MAEKKDLRMIHASECGVCYYLGGVGIEYSTIAPEMFAVRRGLSFTSAENS